MGKPARCLAVFGSGSDVGKSVTAAALCRIFYGMGLRVAPFKAQNMSNNSSVTMDGGEIGRAQAVQAECCGVEPSVHMNPLLLKPSAENRSQMVLLGKVAGEMTSGDFRKDKTWLFSRTQESLDKLRAANDLVIIEGAGSCAEVNLREFDLANFRTAISCGAPVLLVADIDRGGVFAQVIGTLELLTPQERAMVRGIIINRFRGDPSLFTEGVGFIERRTGLPVLGVIPQFTHITIDHEDSVSLEKLTDPQTVALPDKINIAVVKLPRISNFTDFAPLAAEPSAKVSYLSKPRALDGMDLLLIPGSKATIADLRWLKETGWADIIKTYAAGGGRVGGICGGYQMMGLKMEDPHGVEGVPGEEEEGLGLLEARTVMGAEKRVARVMGRWVDGGHRLSGYEIHMGITITGNGVLKPLEMMDEDGAYRPEGAMSHGGKVWGGYVHGLFDEPSFRVPFLKGLKSMDMAGAFDSGPSRQGQYDLLAEHFKRHLDMDKLLEIAGVAAYQPPEER
ncbi:MAG: cobyric acid synthase [Nitrospinae bacterium]|nr:cobyric acid synthase [Nitrospinota bacterium]